MGQPRPASSSHPPARRQRHTSSPAPAIATPAAERPTASPTTRLMGVPSESALATGEGLVEGVPTTGGIGIDWYTRENPVSVPDKSV